MDGEFDWNEFLKDADEYDSAFNDYSYKRKFPVKVIIPKHNWIHYTSNTAYGIWFDYDCIATRLFMLLYQATLFQY